MKRIQLKAVIAWLLLVILGLIVLHAPLTVFVESRWPSVGDVAKSWKELLTLTALVLLVVDISRRKLWARFTHDKLLWLLLAYAVLHGVVALFDGVALLPTIAGLMIDLRYVAYFAAVYMFLQLYHEYRRAFLHIGLAGAVVVIGFAVLQQVLPRDFLAGIGYSKATIQPYLTVDENPNFVRHSSTLRGPNPLGAYAVIVLAGVLAVGRRLPGKKVQWWRLGLGLGALVALWTSQSRSAWLAAVAAVAIVLAVRYWRVAQRQFAGVAVLAVVVSMVGLYAIRDTTFYHNVILHDNPTTGAEIDSNTGHVDSLVEGSLKVAQHPLGSGVGSTGSASLYSDTPVIVENQYLFIAHEVGWLGLALFIAIYYVVMVRLWRERQDWRALAICASSVGLAIVGILLPVWVDDTVAMIWWGLAAVVLAQKGSEHGTSTNKKAKRTT